jgi:hypothetical protein
MTENHEFTKFDFSTFNETDVREEVISPLLRRLGYKKGTSADIIREYTLNYPQISLGRKNPSKDPKIRGRADYICEIDQSTRWIIEAKPPQEEISPDDLYQAYTYANHPEVKAFYFCLINGYQIALDQTNQGPNAKPVLELLYEELENKFQILKNILSPDSIRRDIPIFQPDTGLPLGDGLGSVVRVMRGSIRFRKSSRPSPVITELAWTITGGRITRNSEAKIVMLLYTETPFPSINEQEQDSIELFSTDLNLSNDSTSPTLFFSQIATVFKAGERTINPATLKPMAIPYNVHANSETRGKCFLSKKSCWESSLKHGTLVQVNP